MCNSLVVIHLCRTARLGTGCRRCLIILCTVPRERTHYHKRWNTVRILCFLLPSSFETERTHSHTHHGTHTPALCWGRISPLRTACTGGWWWLCIEMFRTRRFRTPWCIGLPGCCLRGSMIPEDTRSKLRRMRLCTGMKRIFRRRMIPVSTPTRRFHLDKTALADMECIFGRLLPCSPLFGMCLESMDWSRW